MTPAPDLPPRVYDFYYQGVWRQRWADNILHLVLGIGMIAAGTLGAQRKPRAAHA